VKQEANQNETVGVKDSSDPPAKELVRRAGDTSERNPYKDIFAVLLVFRVYV